MSYINAVRRAFPYLKETIQVLDQGGVLEPLAHGLIGAAIGNIGANVYNMFVPKHRNVNPYISAAVGFGIGVSPHLVSSLYETKKVLDAPPPSYSYSYRPSPPYHGPAPIPHLNIDNVLDTINNITARESVEKYPHASLGRITVFTPFDRFRL